MKHEQKMPQSPTYWSDRMRCTHVRTSPTSFLRIERTWRSRKRSLWSTAAVRGEGGDFGGGSEGFAVTGRVVVTRTGHCHPRGYRRHDLPPCKITLCRARWEITFCPSITGWIFGRRDPIISNEIRLRFEISPDIVRTSYSLIYYETFG